MGCTGACVSYLGLLLHIWDKVFKNGPSKTCKRQPSKNLKVHGLLKAAQGCLPQILLGPFLNTLSHLSVFLTVFTISRALMV